MSDKVYAFLILFVQVACATFFLSDIVFTTFGLPFRPINWELRELLEIGASVGLVMAVILGAIMLQRTLRRTRLVEDRLRRASGAFSEVMHERFVEWSLTPAERDVALFAIKGMSTQEIAALRNTSEGTVKAQTNAIYRKAGVTGRPQLLSLFIDDLISGELSGELSAAARNDIVPPALEAEVSPLPYRRSA